MGWVDGDAAELAVHNGRIFVSTWPDFSKLFDDNDDYAGIWMSPFVGADGLHHCDAQSWVKIWSANDFEQDEIAARIYNGGALYLGMANSLNLMTDPKDNKPEGGWELIRLKERKLPAIRFKKASVWRLH